MNVFVTRVLRVCLGPGAVEESQEKCLSRPDKERGREEDDGKTAEPRRRLAEAEKFQDLQRDRGRQVHLFLSRGVYRSLVRRYSDYNKGWRDLFGS